MIVCPRCSKDNQDHYKFCLGCGAELPRNAASPKAFTAPTPPAGMPTGGGGGGAMAAAATPAAPVPVAKAAPAPASGAMAGGQICPSCGSPVPPNFKFCGSCGHTMGGSVQGMPAAAAPSAAATPAAAPAASRGALVLIRPDGSEGETFPLTASSVVGRDAGGVFAADSYLSPKHATFRFEGANLKVKDESSLNGIYLRMAPDAPAVLDDGSIFRIGQEILRFEKLPKAGPGANGVEAMGGPNPGFLGRIRLVTGKDQFGGAYCIPPQGMHMGRERGDVIFPDDGYVSGLHCRLHGEGGKVFLTDVGSSNGTFMRIKGETPVPSGSLLLMGQQLFRAQY